MHKSLRRLSPALVISVIALFVALGGSTYAATLALPPKSVGASQLKPDSVSTSKIQPGAVTAGKIDPTGLKVPKAGHATTANTANFADQAGTAASADDASNAKHADNATNATNATIAANSGALGGLAASGYQQRVTGTCSTAVSTINQNGSVGCATGTVMPIDMLLAHGSDGSQSFGDLIFGARCDELGGTEFDFTNTAPSNATLNYFIWDQSGPVADGKVVPANSAPGVPFNFLGSRVEGQFIFSIHNKEEITVNLHAIDNSSCEITGTAEIAPE